MVVRIAVDVDRCKIMEGGRKEEEYRKCVIVGGENEGAGVVVTIVEDVNRCNLSKECSANQIPAVYYERGKSR